MEPKRLFGHRNAVTAVTWNVDGSRVLAAGDSSSVLIYDATRLESSSYQDQRFVDECRGHTKKISALMASPTSPYMLATAGFDNLLNVFDTRMGGRAVQSFTFKSPCLHADWAADGNTIGVGLASDTVSFIDCLSWTVRTDKEKVFDGDVNQFRWTPNARRILFGRANGYVELYEWPSMDLILTLQGNVGSCLDVSWDPSFRYFAVASVDTTVSIWDANSMTNIFTIDRWEISLHHVAYSYDTGFLAVAGDFDQIDIVDADDGSHKLSIPTPAPVSSLAWHPSRHLLVYSLTKGGRERYNTSESGPPIYIWTLNRNK